MSYRDSERFRKVYSYFRPVPRPTDNTYSSGVTKDYVDDLFNSLDWKQSVQYASDKNVDLTAVHTLVNDVDSAFLGGQLLVDEDRVLLRAQTNPAENGLYIWYTATSKFVRTLDSAQDSITCGATCYVDTGSFGGQVWLMESVDPITVDTSPQVWTMLVSLSGSANDVVQYFTSSLAGYVSTTGSMSFNGGDASVNETWNVGSDVFFYVSGTKGLDGSAGKVSVFGGDMVVSGNIDITDGNVEITGSLYVSGVFDIMADTIEVTGTVYATQGFSGSLTNLTDGTSFIAAGDNITVTSASNGQITITGMSSAPMLWTEVSPVVGSPGAISTTSSVVIGQFSTSSFGTDIMFYVTSSFGSPRQASVFMGDVVVSGNLGLGGDRLEITGSLAVSGAFDVTGDTVEITGSLYVSGVCDIIADTLEVTGTVYATQGFSGSLTNLTDGTSFIAAGDNITVTSASSGQITITAVIPEEIDVWTDLGNTLVTTSSVGIGTGSFFTSVGTDVFFYVSGSTRLTGSTGKVSVFGGDVVVSGNIDLAGDTVEITGSLYVSGVFDIMADTLEVTGTVYATQGFSGSLTNLTDGKSYLVAGSGVSITSSTIGQVTVSISSVSTSLLAQARLTPVDSYTSIQWKLTEASTPWANTGNGGALNLTKVNGTSDATPVTGLFGTARDLNSTILTSGPTHAGEPTGKAFTFSAWVTPFQLGGEVLVAIKSLSDSSWNVPYCMFMLRLPSSSNGAWQAMLATTDKGYGDIITATNRNFLLRLRETSFLAATYDGSRLRLYFDGALAADASWTGDVLTGLGSWQLGGVSNGAIGNTAIYHGRIEDVRVENVCRSQAYLEAQYRAGTCLFV